MLFDLEAKHLRRIRKKPESRGAIHAARKKVGLPSGLDRQAVAKLAELHAMRHAGRLIGVRRVDVEAGAVEPGIGDPEAMNIVLLKVLPPATIVFGVTLNDIAAL